MHWDMDHLFHLLTSAFLHLLLIIHNIISRINGPSIVLLWPIGETADHVAWSDWFRSPLKQTLCRESL